MNEPLKHERFEHEPSRNTADGDPLWDAFRYVSDEMTAAEAEQFEQRMLRDVRLCQAVVEATRLTVAVAARGGSQAAEVATSGAPQPVRLERLPVHDTPAPRGRTASSSRATLASLAAVVACVGLLWSVSQLSRSETEFVALGTSPGAEMRDQDAELIVSVWATESASDNENIDDLEGDMDPALDVPEWLLTAVTISDVEPELMESEDMDL